VYYISGGPCFSHQPGDLCPPNTNPSKWLTHRFCWLLRPTPRIGTFLTPFVSIFLSHSYGTRDRVSSPTSPSVRLVPNSTGSARFPLPTICLFICFLLRFIWVFFLEHLLGAFRCLPTLLQLFQTSLLHIGPRVLSWRLSSSIVATLHR